VKVATAILMEAVPMAAAALLARAVTGWTYQDSTRRPRGTYCDRRLHVMVAAKKRYSLIYTSPEAQF
jgi:hypothetical protein